MGRDIKKGGLKSFFIFLFLEDEFYYNYRKGN